MDTTSFYEHQATIRETGAAIDGRVKKAASLFRQHLGKAQRLLDIGCGVGDITLYLGQGLGAAEVWGADISEQRVEVARRKGINGVVADLNRESLPFQDGYFDGVFCGEIIEHLIDPDQLLMEVRRLLRPKGVCVLTTPNLAAWYNRVALLLGWQPFNTSVSFRHEVSRPKFLSSDYGCRDHLRVFTWGALRELIRVHDLDWVDVVGVSLLESSKPNWWSKPGRALLYAAVCPLDLATSLVPSLSTGLVVAFKKP